MKNINQALRIFLAAFGIVALIAACSDNASTQNVPQKTVVSPPPPGSFNNPIPVTSGRYMCINGYEYFEYGAMVTPVLENSDWHGIPAVRLCPTN